MKFVDLRSDTVTQPGPAMREAMATAEVGDAVIGDDPTVNRLEARVAEVLGKEAAIFVPSGTMANQVAVRSHTEPGDEIIIEGQAHLYYYEAGATAALSGVICRCLNGRRGIFSAAEVEAVLRPRDLHFAPSRLVCVENTHNRGGGSVWPFAAIQEVCQSARNHGLKLHLDGARLWNATAATGIPEEQWAAGFDSVSVCFSKGLGAPVGSALAGGREFVERAKRFRKQFGGGMRQAGIIAAGALYALENNRARLKVDHENARRLAEGLGRVAGMEVEIGAVETNIVQIRLETESAPALAQELDRCGIKVLATGPRLLRAVTHLHISAEDIDWTIATWTSVMSCRTVEVTSSRFSRGLPS